MIKRSTQRDCFLYTLDGVKEAKASKTFINRHGRDVSRITANDKSVIIHVSAGTYDRKFWNEEKPTFYAC